MRISEWVTLAYFAYLLATGIVLRVAGRKLAQVVVLSLLVGAIIAVLRFFEPAVVSTVLRDWLPGGYLITGYWATGLLYRGPNRALEACLASIDERLADWLRPLLARVPRAVAEMLELAYLLCYPLVPSGLAVLYATGYRARADAYWVLVLTATFAAYGVLPWAGTRPPRSLGSRHWLVGTRPMLMHHVNLTVLHNASIQVNTFPSGHAASAWAAALFLATVPGAWGLLFVVIAACIAAGAVAGRYHYAVDVAAGIAVAVIVFVLR